MTNKDTNYFGKGLRFWLGMIVKFDKQKSQTAGMGWGWRYKVRIIGDYSDNDSVDDKEVHTALALLPTTGGTGGAGKKATVKLTQGDVVFGAFLTPPTGFPVILGALGRTKEINYGKDSKLSPKSGFTGEQKAGLTQNQEYSGQDQIVTPRIREATEKGNGKSKESPTKELSNVKGGTDPEENAINAVEQPMKTDAKRGKDLWDGQKKEKLTLAQLRARTAERENSPGNRVGDVVDISEEIDKEKGYARGTTKSILDGDKPADAKEIFHAQREVARKNDARIKYEQQQKQAQQHNMARPDYIYYKKQSVN